MGKCDAGSGVSPVAVALTLAGSCLPRLSPCVLQSLRCCDAGSGVVSLACLPQLLRSEARCCDDGSGVVSRLSPCVSQSLRSDARCVTPALGLSPSVS